MKKVKIKFWEYHEKPNMMSLLLDLEFKNLMKMLLKRIVSIFDPVGILSPAVVPLKILFQKMCKEGSNWDDDINDKCKVVWKTWLLIAQKTPYIVLLCANRETCRISDNRIL